MDNGVRSCDGQWCMCVYAALLLSIWQWNATTLQKITKNKIRLVEHSTVLFSTQSIHGFHFLVSYSPSWIGICVTNECGQSVRWRIFSFFSSHTPFRLFNNSFMIRMHWFNAGARAGHKKAHKRCDERAHNIQAHANIKSCRKKNKTSSNLANYITGIYIVLFSHC